MVPGALSEMGWHRQTTTHQSFPPPLSSTQDPDFPGHSALEQYAAQLLSSVRPGLSDPNAGYLFRSASAHLAASLLLSGVLAADTTAATRLANLLAGTLQDFLQATAAPGHAAWVSAQLRVSVLRACAAVLLLSRGRPAPTPRDLAALCRVPEATPAVRLQDLSWAVGAGAAAGPRTLDEEDEAEADWGRLRAAVDTALKPQLGPLEDLWTSLLTDAAVHAAARAAARWRRGPPGAEDGADDGTSDSGRASASGTPGGRGGGDDGGGDGEFAINTVAHTPAGSVANVPASVASSAAPHARHLSFSENPSPLKGLPSRLNPAAMDARSARVDADGRSIVGSAMGGGPGAESVLGGVAPALETSVLAEWPEGAGRGGDPVPGYLGRAVAAALCDVAPAVAAVALQHEAAKHAARAAAAGWDEAGWGAGAGAKAGAEAEAEVEAEEGGGGEEGGDGMHPGDPAVVDAKDDKRGGGGKGGRGASAEEEDFGATVAKAAVDCCVLLAHMAAEASSPGQAGRGAPMGAADSVWEGSLLRRAPALTAEEFRNAVLSGVSQDFTLHAMVAAGTTAAMGVTGAAPGAVSWRGVASVAIALETLLRGPANAPEAAEGGSAMAALRWVLPRTAPAPASAQEPSLSQALAALSLLAAGATPEPADGPDRPGVAASRDGTGGVPRLSPLCELLDNVAALLAAVSGPATSTDAAQSAPAAQAMTAVLAMTGRVAATLPGPAWADEATAAALGRASAAAAQLLSLRAAPSAPSPASAPGAAPGQGKGDGDAWGSFDAFGGTDGPRPGPAAPSCDGPMGSPLWWWASLALIARAGVAAARAPNGPRTVLPLFREASQAAARLFVSTPGDRGASRDAEGATGDVSGGAAGSRNTGAGAARWPWACGAPAAALAAVASVLQALVAGMPAGAAGAFDADWTAAAAAAVAGSGGDGSAARDAVASAMVKVSGRRG